MYRKSNIRIKFMKVSSCMKSINKTNVIYFWTPCITSIKNAIAYWSWEWQKSFFCPNKSKNVSQQCSRFLVSLKLQRVVEYSTWKLFRLGSAQVGSGLLISNTRLYRVFKSKWHKFWGLFTMKYVCMYLFTLCISSINSAFSLKMYLFKS